MIYSFCNLHDVSWGTKGDNTTPLNDTAPVVSKKTENGDEVFVIMIPDDDQECSMNWNNFQKELIINRNFPTINDSGPNLATKKEDNCKEFRTKVILSWLLSNVSLIIVFTVSSILT